MGGQKEGGASGKGAEDGRSESRGVPVGRVLKMGGQKAGGCRWEGC